MEAARGADAPPAAPSWRTRCASRRWARRVAQIAHEVNQPLASIANFAQRADRPRSTAARVDPDARARGGRADRRRGAARRRGHPPPAWLAAQGRALKVQRCDANDVVRDALRLVEPDLRTHAIHLDLGLATATAAGARWTGCRSGRWSSTSCATPLEALAAQPDGARDLAVDSERRGDHVIAVRVRDTGVGLPAAAGTEIFDPFFTTKHDALGLGLSISRSIVQAHGGELWARANHDRGATVGFTLPARVRGQSLFHRGTVPFLARLLHGVRMQIGMNLPVMVPGLDRAAILEWARRIDAGPFATLAAGERINFPNPGDHGDAGGRRGGHRARAPGLPR